MNNANKMTLRLMRIDPVKYATIATLVYLLILVLVYVPLVLIASLAGATADLAGGAAIFGGGILWIILSIIFMGAIVFVITLIASAVLNFILKKVNGIDIDFEKAGLGISEIGNQDRLGQ